jgi:hypothetical protein
MGSLVYFDEVYHCVQLCCSSDHGLMRLCPLDILVEPHQRQEAQLGMLNLVAENLAVENLGDASPIAVNAFLRV